MPEAGSGGESFGTVLQIIETIADDMQRVLEFHSDAVPEGLRAPVSGQLTFGPRPPDREVHRDPVTNGLGCHTRRLW
jgi:hypothetical protein